MTIRGMIQSITVSIFVTLGMIASTDSVYTHSGNPVQMIQRISTSVYYPHTCQPTRDDEADLVPLTCPSKEVGNSHSSAPNNTETADNV